MEEVKSSICGQRIPLAVRMCAHCEGDGKQRFLPTVSEEYKRYAEKTCYMCGGTGKIAVSELNQKPIRVTASKTWQVRRTGEIVEVNRILYEVHAIHRILETEHPFSDGKGYLRIYKQQMHLVRLVDNEPLDYECKSWD